jgi:outer membrane protein assembly factor BamB/predicted MPP superfamily phosphohydrolase
MNKGLLFILVLIIGSLQSFSQDFKFAFLSDTHIGVKNADEDLRRSVADINADTALKFVIISGDITELGIDEEVLEAKNILSKLTKPVYIVTGNHDGNWSPTGGSVFRKVIGPGRFSFQYNGYLFIGTNSGPNMQHKGPGQVPKEDIVWMDSILNNVKDKNIPVIYVNHFPQDSSQRNWFEVMDRLKKRNLQLFLAGHLHQNHDRIFEGVPGIIGRTNMRGKDTVGAFNVVTFSNGKATFEERKPLTNIQHKWAEATLYSHKFKSDTTHYPHPSYAINNAFPNVKTIWQYEDKFDIGAGTAVKNNLVIATNTEGLIYALDVKDGRKMWAFKTNGKIYSTPAIILNYVVVASTDSVVYCLNPNDGRLVWRYKTSMPVVASPAIHNGIVYLGASDGHFRAIQLKDGKLLWDFSKVKDFVMTKPLVYNGKVYFGSWGNEFYALDATSGRFAWKWNDTSNNRMFSSASCRPVATKGKVFIVAPDQYMTAFNASSGNVLWRQKMPEVKVRESMGLSADSSMVYVKTTDGRLYSISTAAAGMQSNSVINLQLGYDIAAAPIIEDKGIIYVPSNAGVVTAVDMQAVKILWKYKTSNSQVTGIIPYAKDKVIVSTVDGKISCLQF